MMTKKVVTTSNCIRKAARKAGKRTEARWAEMLGGKRIPSPGRSNRDMTTSYNLCVEMKHRKARVPLWIRRALAQAEADARLDEIPVFIRHDKGDLWENDIVVMDGASFMRVMRTVGMDVEWEEGQ